MTIKIIPNGSVITLKAIHSSWRRFSKEMEKRSWHVVEATSATRTSNVFMAQFRLTLPNFYKLMSVEARTLTGLEDVPAKTESGLNFWPFKMVEGGFGGPR